MLVNRWQRLLEQKPVPLLDHLLNEASRLFAQELASWPPPVTEVEAGLAGCLAGSPTRPDPRVYREAFALARMDLLRDLDGISDYHRNQRWLEAGLTAKDKDMVSFLSRLISEQLLTFREATQGKVSRARLVGVLDETATHLLRGGAP